jgi:murein DD-endopeptidase MepM/ murein hydrolase activator NlpD
MALGDGPCQTPLLRSAPMPVVRDVVAGLLATAVVAAVPVGAGSEDQGSAGGLSGPSRILRTASIASSSGVPALAAPTQEGPAPGPAYGSYAWPVRGPVLRGFDPPDSPYGSGHRGIDIGAPMGTTVVAAQAGTVAFAGPVAGGLFVSIDHPDGVRTTYSWLSEVSVRQGATLERGEPIGRSGTGHPGPGPPHLHFGARIGSVYLDPMLLLERGSLVGLVHLAPLD